MKNNFIVLSHPRSGTTYLTNYILASHSEVHCYDELFFLSDTTKNWLNLIGHNTMKDFPFNYYKKYISSNYSLKRYLINYTKKVQKFTGKNIIGFKLFPAQLKKNEIEYLLVDQLIPIVLLKRKNIIQSAISYQIAKITGQWSYKNKDDLEKFSIDTFEIEKFIKFNFDRLLFFEKLLIKHDIPFYKCYYENLFQLESINRVFNFLDVPPISEIPKGDKKLNTPDRYKKIINLKEIENKFCNDEYGYLFEE